MKTQESMLIDHFLAGGKITQLEALQKYGVGRLASRICDLKHDGYRIESAYRTVRKADGSEANVKEYWMEPGKYAYMRTVKVMEGLEAVQAEDLTVRIIWEGLEIASAKALRIMDQIDMHKLAINAFKEASSSNG